jgi:hypothetical protein
MHAYDKRVRIAAIGRNGTEHLRFWFGDRVGSPYIHFRYSLWTTWRITFSSDGTSLRVSDPRRTLIAAYSRLSFEKLDSLKYQEL